MENYDKIYGRNAVKELLQSKRPIAKLYVEENYDRALAHIVSMARENGVFVQKTNRKKLELFTNTKNHQGIVAFTLPFAYTSVEEMVKQAKAQQEDPLLLLLDEIVDPHNLGALARSAALAGAHGLITTKRRSATISEGVYKASAGAIEHIPIAQVANIPTTIEKLKKQGLFIVGLDLDGDDYDTLDYTMPMGIVVGNEGRGLSRLVREACDYIATIPTTGVIDSLNASVAGSIVLFEAIKQRKNKSL